MIIKEEKQLVDLGFTKYKRTFIDPNGVKYRYQKCFKDSIGKRYYLDCLVWDQTEYPQVAETDTYEFEAQLYQYGTHEAIDLIFHTRDIDEITKFIDSLFSTGLVEYYEKWRDEDV